MWTATQFGKNCLNYDTDVLLSVENPITSVLFAVADAADALKRNTSL